MSRHVTPEILVRYATGSPLSTDVEWAVEAHLTGCAGCRAALATALARHAPAAYDLVQQVHGRVAAQLVGAPPQRQAWSWCRTVALRWVTPVLAPWLLTTVLVVAAAVGFDLLAATSGGRLPSLVMLVAPITPLLGVAAAWSRQQDPAYEIVAATVRGGLHLVFRRTASVLTLVVPVLAVAGRMVDASPARWLLPCLAFTLGALALGQLVGLRRAAWGLVLFWSAAVVAPSVVTARTPALLEAASFPGWTVCAAVAAVVVLARGRTFGQLPSGR